MLTGEGPVRPLKGCHKHAIKHVYNSQHWHWSLLLALEAHWIEPLVLYLSCNSVVKIAFIWNLLDSQAIHMIKTDSLILDFTNVEQYSYVFF